MLYRRRNRLPINRMSERSVLINDVVLDGALRSERAASESQR